MGGWSPWWRRMSISSIACSAPATSASTSSAGSAGEREDAAVVLAVGVAVEDPGVRRRASPRARRSPARFGPRRSWGRRAAASGARRRDVGAQTSSSPSRTIASPSSSTVGFITTQSRWTGTWTVPPIAAEAPKATWQRAEDLLVLEDVAGQHRLLVGADAELGDVGAVLAVRGEQLHEAPSPGRRGPRSGGRPRPSARPARRPGRRRRSSRRRPACPLPSTGAMKPSPQGRLPKAPRLGQLAGVGDRLAALEAEPQVGAVRAGDARLGRARRAPRRPRGPCGAAPPCRRSSPGPASPR